MLSVQQGRCMIYISTHPIFIGEGVLHYLLEARVTHQVREFPNLIPVLLQKPSAEGSYDAISTFLRPLDVLL